MIRVEAQALIDSFAAAGLLAYVLATLVRRPDGPLTPRVIFLFGLMAVFYGLRSALGWTGYEPLERWTLAAISLVPLAALLVAEGLLRRHAPRALKILIVLCAAAAVAFALFGSSLGLVLPVVVALTAILILLATRDRASLSASENAAVGSLAIGLAGALPLIFTDFPQLLAVAPIGLSPLAVLLVVSLASADTTSETRDQWIEVALTVIAAAALTFGLSRALSITHWADGLRLAAVMLTGLITTSLLVRIRPFGAAAQRHGLRQWLGVADTGSLESFLRDMAQEPMLRDLIVLGEADLVDHQPQALAAVLAERPVWSAVDLRTGPPGEGEVTREAVLDLLEQAGGTHIGVLSPSPLRIGIVALPGLLHDTEVETDLALVFRMARLASEAAR